MSTSCLWCQRETGGEPGSEEHVIPEAIGCPPGFVLPKGTVCRSCNNGLATLDQAVAQDYDFFTFWSGVPRKRCRPPAIDSRGNLKGSVKGRKPELHIEGSLAADNARPGRAVVLSKPGSRNVSVELDLSADGTLNIGMKAVFGNRLRFVRGIVKIALSAVAFYHRDGALESRFDEVRDFVRTGRGKRHVIFIPSADQEYRHRIGPALVTSSGLIWSYMRLGPLEFFVDLSERMQLLSVLCAELERLRPGQYAVLPAVAGAGMNQLDST